MRIITSDKITDVVKDLCIKANTVLRPDVLLRLKKAYKDEKNKLAKKILGAIIANSVIARREGLAICQDTGLPVVFVVLGQEIKIDGDLKEAIYQGIEKGYRQGYLRQSIVKDPLTRGKSGYRGGVIHTDVIKGNKLKITVLPKGFGCENKSALKMFLPTASLSEIKKFIIETVKTAGPDACPPYVIGVGIGGTADYACFLAKKALLKKLYAKRYTLYTKFESELLKEINKLNIGPMGLGGKTTALALNIETFPTHIAGLPVAVNLSCHALRSASAVL